MDRKLHFETLAQHAGQELPDSATGSRAVPIYQTSSYVFKDFNEAAARFDMSEPGCIYTRIENPTTDVFETRMSALEGGVGALATASGAAAVYYAILNLCRAGDHIVAANTLYGGTFNLLKSTLPDYGIETTFVNPDDPEQFEKAIRPNTKLIYYETLGNPNCNIIDYDEVGKIAQKAGIPVIVDNTFATPYLFRPFEHGANIVIHSATKFIGGHGTSIGGIIVDGGNFDWNQNDKFPSFTKPNESYHGLIFSEAVGKSAFIVKARALLMHDTGAVLSPFNSFLFLQGLESLSLRVERHVENAQKVAEFLSHHPKIERVNYPSLKTSPYYSLSKKYFPLGTGSIFTFDIKGGKAEAAAFINKLQIFSLLANVADSKSLVIHPATTTHGQVPEADQKAAGILPGTIRLSIGLEHIDDILWDLDQALN